MNALSLCLSLTLPLQTAPPATIDFAEAWSAVEGRIERGYYARDTRKEEMTRLLAEAAPKAKSAKSMAEFSKTVNDMILKFKDSHFGFMTVEDQDYYTFTGLAGAPEDMPHIGAYFKPAGDGYTVTMVMEGLPGAEAGLRKGDVIKTVAGKPFTPVMALKDRQGETLEFAIEREGKPMKLNIEVNRGPALRMFLDGSRNSSRVIEFKGKKYGYFHLWMMANDDFRNALSSAVYGKLRDTDGFILDLRDGYGGRPEGFGDPFFRPEVMMESRIGNGAGMKQLFGYGRPLVVLINAGSRSAKEVFSFVIKKSKRGTLIGETTGGRVLGTSPTRLNAWSFLAIPLVEVLTDGERIEGKGVTPDIAVTKEFDAEGKDLYVERALEFLSSGR